MICFKCFSCRLCHLEQDRFLSVVSHFEVSFFYPNDPLFYSVLLKLSCPISEDADACITDEITSAKLVLKKKGKCTLYFL